MEAQEPSQTQILQFSAIALKPKLTSHVKFQLLD